MAATCLDWDKSASVGKLQSWHVFLPAIQSHPLYSVLFNLKIPMLLKQFLSEFVLMNWWSSCWIDVYSASKMKHQHVLLCMLSSCWAVVFSDVMRKLWWLQSWALKEQRHFIGKARNECNVFYDFALLYDLLTPPENEC